MFCRPITLCLLNCITEIIQVSKGCKYFPQGPKVGSPAVQHHIRKVCEKITKMEMCVAYIMVVLD